jgi:hypothetical protein
VLIAADDALKSAAEVEDRTSEIDKKFEEAIDMLSAFEKNFPFEPPKLGPNIVGTVTRGASDQYKYASMILSLLKCNLHSRVKFLRFSFTSQR